MKLLFDQNLSHKLVDAVSSICAGSTHVRLVGLDRADDEAIWQYALNGGFAVVSQDTDFVERALLRGTPPAVICMKLGNTSTRNLRDVLLRNLPDIIAAANESLPPHVWEIDRP